MNAWRNFKQGVWTEKIDVRDFVINNITSYEGDKSFLKGPTERTKNLYKKVSDLFVEENKKGGVLNVDTEHVSSILAFAPGYIDKDNELIFGLQTDAPLKRAVNPFAGFRNAEQACEAYGYKMSDEIKKFYTYRTTHNDGVFRAYTDTMKKARHAGILTGLPDAYGRGRLIGDYRRLALYGMNRLIEEKIADKNRLGERDMNDETIRTIEDISRQLQFMKALVQMASDYGFDITRPAENAREAIQWLYFAYLPIEFAAPFCSF